MILSRSRQSIRTPPFLHSLPRYAATESSSTIVSPRPYYTASTSSIRSPSNTSPSISSSFNRPPLTSFAYSKTRHHHHPSSRPYTSHPPVSTTNINPSKLPPTRTPPTSKPYASLATCVIQPDPIHSRPFPLVPSPPRRDFVRIAPNDPRSPAVKWLAFGWRYFVFLSQGFKVTWNERKEALEIRDRVRRGEGDKNWKEDLMIRRVNLDVLKLPFMVAITLLADEAIPLILWLMPTALPSTFLLPTQLENVLIKRDQSLVKSRAHVYDLLSIPRPDGKAALDVGWDGSGWCNWSEEEFKAILQVYNKVPWIANRNLLENKLRQHIISLTTNDDLLDSHDPNIGFTREEFLVALMDRGLLAYHEPTSSLPIKLDTYLASSRTVPTFSPLMYLIEDIKQNHPIEMEAFREREREVLKEREREMEENGGYYGWKAGIRRWFVEPKKVERGKKEGNKLEEVSSEVRDRGGEEEEKVRKTTTTTTTSVESDHGSSEKQG